MNEFWITVINVLSNYGALGVIVSVILYVYVKREEVNSKNNTQREIKNNENFSLLVKNLIQINRENGEIWNNTLKELKKSVEDSSNCYTYNESKLENEMTKFKQEILELNNEIMSSVINNKILNRDLFYKLAYLTVAKETYLGLIDFYNYIEDSNFYDENLIESVIETSGRILEAHRSRISQELSSLNYEKHKIQQLLFKIEEITEVKQINIEKYIYENIKPQELLRGSNLKLLKQLISSKFVEYIDKIEEEVRKC